MWFVVITCVDFVVSVVYTVQAIARIEYAVYLRVRKKDRVSIYMFIPSEEPLGSVPILFSVFTSFPTLSEA